jgi:signal transduction histidine kinase/ligand-binding sensor domain-containing protein
MLRWQKPRLVGHRLNCAILCCCLHVLALHAQNARKPDIQISQYGHTALRVQDGDIPANLTAWSHTDDGFIWVGTSRGLMRFDGVRFTPWQAAPGEALPDPEIQHLFKARDGSLWIATRLGISHLKNGHLTNLPQFEGRVRQMIEDREGSVWFTRSNFDPRKVYGALCKVIGSGFRCFGSAEGISLPFADGLEEDSQGYLWVASDVELIRWMNGRSQKIAIDGLRNSQGLFGISTIFHDTDGSMWVGMYRGGPGLGLEHIVGSKLEPLRVPGFDSSTLSVADVYRDSAGSLWIATQDKGVYRIFKDRVDHYGMIDGLTSDVVYGIGDDPEGNVWVLTDQGADRFHRLPVVTFSARQGFGGSVAPSAVATREGELWVGSNQGIDIVKDGLVKHLTEHNGLPGVGIRSIFQDSQGRIWLSVDKSLAVFDKGKFTVIKGPSGINLGFHQDITEDRDGAIWISHFGPEAPGLYRVQNGLAEKINLPPDAPAVWSVAANSNGGIWLGLMNGDLAEYKNGKVSTYPTQFGPHGHTPSVVSPLRNIVVEPENVLLAAHRLGLMEKRGSETKYLTAANGLPCDGLVSTFQRDLHGNLYVMLDCALISIASSEMQRWWNDPSSKIDFVLYDNTNGVRSGKTQNAPSAAITADGRVWFALSTSILQMIDPDDLSKNRVRPPVTIESLSADGIEYPVKSGLRLPPHLRSFSVDYTALSFVNPHKVHFRYRLEGHDTEWQDAGTRRQAFYNDLPPGPYSFHVIASNNDGVWNQDGAVVSFYVMPTFYQRLSFKITIGLLSIALLWALYLYRVNRATEGVRLRLMERISERERIARDLHDTFFQGIQGLLLRFNTGTNQLPSDTPARPIFVAALEQSDQVMLEGRKLVLDLREENESAVLEDVLARTGEDLGTQYPVPFKLTVLGTPRGLQPDASRELYSLGREALYNAFRHANAKLIELELDYSAKGIVLKVRDDGDGMSEEVLRDKKRPGHWGLPGMFERAEKIDGTLTLWSRAGSGTEIEVSVPAETVYREESKSFLPEWFIRLFRPRTSVAG